MFGWGRRARQTPGASGQARSGPQRAWSARPPEVIANVQRGELRKARPDKARFERLALAVHGRPAAVVVTGPQGPGAVPFGASRAASASSGPAQHAEDQAGAQGGQA